MSASRKPARDADRSSHGSMQAAAEAGRSPAAGAALGKHREAAHPRARASRGGGWMEWCDKWLNPPEGDPIEHEKRARADFARYAQKVVDEDIEEMIDAGIDAWIDAWIDASIDAGIDARMKRRDEEATERQIMVDNFRVFRRDYINMAIRRSC